MGIQILLLLVIILLITRTIIRYRQKAVSKKFLIWWLFVWVVGGVIIATPELTNRLADYLGVGRGVDVALYLSILLIFYLLFKLYNKLVKIEEDIIKIVRELALRSDENNEPKKRD